MVVLVGPDHRAAASLVETLAAGSMVDEHIDGGGGHVVNVPGRGARPPLRPRDDSGAPVAAAATCKTATATN